MPESGGKQPGFFRRLIDRQAKIGRLKRTLTDRKINIDHLRKELSTVTTKLDQCEQNHSDLEGKFQELSMKQNLIKAALGAAPISDPDFTEYHRLYAEVFLPFANRESSLAEEARSIEELLRIEKELKLISQFPKVRQRRIIAVGGGFSAGKSQFLSSFVRSLEIDIPIGINPVTAFPTYMISEEGNSIRGIAPEGGDFDISDIFSRLDHRFTESLGFNLRSIMPKVTMETPLAYPEGPRKGENIAHICFIDTPGYNAAGSYAADDRAVSLPYLEEADALLWLIGVDSNGTIPHSDLNLLEKLELGAKEKQLYIIANKADCKTRGDLKMIVEKIAEELEDRSLDFAGISAFSSTDTQEHLFHKQSLFDFLDSQDRALDTSHKIFKMIAKVMYDYRNALQATIDHIYDVFGSLKKLELDVLESGDTEVDLSEGIQAIRERFNLEKPRSELAELKVIGGRMLAAAAKIMGSGTPSELDIDPHYRPKAPHYRPKALTKRKWNDKDVKIRLLRVRNKIIIAQQERKERRLRKRRWLWLAAGAAVGGLLSEFFL